MCKHFCYYSNGKSQINIIYLTFTVAIVTEMVANICLNMNMVILDQIINLSTSIILKTFAHSPDIAVPLHFLFLTEYLDIKDF